MNNSYKIILLLSLSLILFSCRHKADEIPSLVYTPGIDIVKGPTYVFQNSILPLNTDFYICLNIYKNQMSGKKIEKMQISRIFDNDTTMVIDSAMSIESETYVMIFKTKNETGLEKWVFSVTDEAGQSASKELMISTEHFPPQLTVVFEKNSVQVQEELKLAVNAKSNSQTGKMLSHIRITRSYNSVYEIVLDSTLFTPELNYFQTYLAISETGDEMWFFELSDINNESTTQTEYINTVVFLNEEHSGMIWNCLSANNYAWDLVQNVPRNITDADAGKDLANLTDSSYTFPPYYFLNSWTALNSTLFKRANGLDYDYATLDAAIDAYSGGSVTYLPNPSATGLAMGDVYVARLRNTNDYVVIQITDVVWTDGDNLDKIEFRYKK